MHTLKRNSLLLILTSFIWGISFVAQSQGGDAIGPFSFNCIRFLLGSAVLVPVILFLDKKASHNNTDEIPLHNNTSEMSQRNNTNEMSQHTKKRDHTSSNKTLWLGGISCGIILCIASNLQQLGINQGTPAGKAGFLTACYIILVPIFGLFLKKKCGWNVWIGVVLTLAGLYLLCMTDSLTLQLSDILVLLCAVIFALHILVIDHFSPLVNGVKMSCIQFFTAGILTAIPMFLIDMKHSLSGFTEWLPSLASWDAWIPLLYAGIMSCGVAYTLQIIGQKGVNPTVASLLLSLESVFSVLAGWILLQEKLGLREILGCVLIFAAIILAQLPSKQKSAAP